MYVFLYYELLGDLTKVLYPGVSVAHKVSKDCEGLLKPVIEQGVCETIVSVPGRPSQVQK